MPGSHPVRWIILLCSALAAFGCANTDTEQGATGSLSLDLVLAGDIQIDVVDWEITGNGMDMGGSVDVSAPGSTASVEVYGLPVGNEPYVVELSAVSVDQQVTCRGSAEFDVEVGVSTPVMVILNCKLPQDLGSVRVNGKLNICAQLTKMVVAPLQTSVGNDISLFSTASDEEGDPIAYMWSSHSGSIANPAAPSTTYTCTEAGDDDITVLVTDDDGTHCMSMWTVRVTCVAGDGNPCDDVSCEDDGNECTSEACNPGTGQCETSNVEEGTDCDGGAGMCTEGTCVAKNLCMDVVCEDDGNDCTAEACNPDTGECESSNVDNGTSCDDASGMCMNGECVADDLCMDVVCEDTGNDCTAAACNPSTGQCETSNVDNGTACDGETGTCNEGMCDPNPECMMDTDCPDTGNECIDAVCDGGTCGTSNNSDACDNGNGTCSAGICEPNDLCMDVVCEDDGNECTDEACNPANGVCETSNNTNACDGGAGTCSAGDCEPNASCEYTQDFESLVAGDPPQSQPTSLADDGWVVGANVFGPDGTTFLYNYFAFPAPNGGSAFSAVATGEGGVAQAAQQMSIYNDYNNADHNVGNVIEAIVFQERPIVAADIGTTITFTFDAKQGNIESPTTALAFIKTLNPGASFSESASDTLDTTSLGTTWGTSTLSIDILAGFEGHILQFGALSRAANFTPSGNFYDNMSVCNAQTPVP